MTSVPQPGVRFKENLTEFFTHIITILKAYPDKFVSVKSVEALQIILGQYQSDAIMPLFINFTQNSWIKIKERDPAFFQSFQSVLSKLPVTEIANSSMLYDIMTMKNGDSFVVGEEYRNIMWNYCESFVRILVDFVHTTRVPRARILPGGAKQAVYTKQFMPNFSMKEHCKVWSIDLKF